METPEQRTQPGRNGGTLKVGGKHRPAGGRPPSEVRDLCRQGFEQALPKLLAIAEGAVFTADQLRAIDLLGKYSGLSSVDVTSGDKPIVTHDEAGVRIKAIFEKG